eukprot:INCI8939.2.p1 GENE.INCI8939.2~~INCI8939.2.p1  ORF type:complete len:787 (-),score=99.24 INCI8939.2:698-3058(-)
MARMILWSAIAAIATIVEASPPSLLFVSTSTSNDFVVAAQKGQLPVKTFSSVENALNAAAEGDGLLVLADDMRPVNPGVPQTNTTVNVSAAEWATIDKLGLNVYIEFPSTLPPSTTTAKVPTAGGGHAPRQAPKAALPVAQTLWERAAVAKAGGLSPQLGYLDLLHPHKHVDYVQLPSDLLPQADVVLGVIAGYDNATFGLPKTSFPLLVSPAEKVLIAATQLSHCRSRRFAPAARWMALAEYIFDFASNSSWSKTEGATSATLWVPTVTASYNRSEPLPGDAELQALQRGVQFYRNARLLPDVSRATELGMLVPSMPDFDLRVREYARMAPPYEARVSGDGQLGIFEGLTSDIDIEGRQPQSNGVRADCVLETSASFAARSIVTANKSDARVAINLLNFGHIHSGFHQPWALGAGQPDAASIHLAQTRPWVVSGDAFGLKAWTTVDHAYTLYYGDDDARGLLGAVATAGLLQSDRWDTTIVTGVLGNLRQTPKNGFAPSSSTFEALVDATTFDPASGWRSRYDSEGGAPNFSPHYESYIWAVYLLGYAQSGFEPLLSRAQTALTTMMENYPSKWIPTANGIAMQRARIILPLAFLVRANDTALHRQWLQTAVDGFLSRQHCEGDWCAYKEELSCPGWGGSTRVPNNDDYGTFEAPLNQENDDPVSDFLFVFETFDHCPPRERQTSNRRVTLLWSIDTQVILPCWAFTRRRQRCRMRPSRRRKTSSPDILSGFKHDQQSILSLMVHGCAHSISKSGKHGRRMRTLAGERGVWRLVGLRVGLQPPLA